MAPRTHWRITAFITIGWNRSVDVGLGEYVTHDFGGLARGLAHGDARRLERVLLVLGGALASGDDGAGVAHLLAFGGGETGDVGDNRLGHVLLGPCGGVLFGEAADFADHHDSLGVGVGFECLDRKVFDPEKVYDRIGLEEETTNILGMKVPAATIPVQTGRNLAVIIEVATMNYRQRAMGNNSAKELMEQLGLTDDVQP